MTGMCDKIVIVDPGKNEVKIFLLDKEGTLKQVFSFPSKSEAVRNFNGIDSSRPLQFKVEIEGEKFLIGEGVKKSYNFDTTKNNNHHKLCIYTAIANVVESANENVYLVLGYPSSDYTNDVKRKEYENMVFGDKEGKVSININGQEKSFNILRIHTQPEGMALLPRLKNGVKGYHIVDIGGQNVNYRKYDKQGNTLFSYSLDKAGINYLEQDLRVKLRQAISGDDVNVEEIDMVKAIEQGHIAMDIKSLNDYDDTKEFVEYTVCKFIEEHILDKLSGQGISLSQKGDPIIFTGGGSLRLEKYVKEMLNNNANNLLFSETAKWDNCISYAIKNATVTMTDKLKAKQVAQKIIAQVQTKDFDINRNPFVDSNVGSIF